MSTFVVWIFIDAWISRDHPPGPYSAVRNTYHLISVFSTRPSGRKKKKKDIPVIVLSSSSSLSFYLCSLELRFSSPESCDSEEYFDHA